MNRGKIRRMLESRDLEEFAASDDDVAGFWNRAIRAYQDSRVPGVSPEERSITPTGSPSAWAPPSCSRPDNRVKATGKHHFVTFYALGAITEGTEMASLAAELDRYRGDRHTSHYGSGMTEERARQQLARLRRLHEKFLPAARAWLLANRGSLEGLLAEIV